MTNSVHNQGIRSQVSKMLATGALGRSRFYAALLEYLLACTERGHTPKEIEIAAEVFNRGDGFDPSQDSMVRVYAHNLRQKLDQYYADQGSAETERVSIPKGEYRLVLVDAGSSTAVPEQPAVRALAGSRVRFAIGAAVLVSLVAGVIIGRLSGASVAESGQASQVVASPLWSDIADDDIPVTVVVGDYYIFGELDSYGNIMRMVREFDVNSMRDLEDRFLLDPDGSDRYMDLDLTYIPTSTASAVQSVASVLASAGKDVRVVPTSHLDTLAIRESHIVYIGYLSAMGMLQDFVFAGSELEIGASYDEIVHKSSGQIFVSEAGLPSGEQRYRDYGFFSTQPGPAGNQLVVIAGMRDEGLMQTAQAVSDPQLIQASIDAMGEADLAAATAYELLYEVAGLFRTNLNSSVVHAAPLTGAYLALH